MITIKQGQKYLVTGGSGFLGGALIERILNQDGQIVTVARNEGNLLKLKQKFPHIEIYTGDISDPIVWEVCMREVTGVFHLAAFKHVTMAQQQARQCTLTNVQGSLNLLNSSVKYNPEFVLGVSTDKAAQIAGVYGASKYIMEKMFEEYEDLHFECDYRMVRYGNVLYSTGSVLCKWRDLLEAGQEVIVTDPTATRYFWTIDQAVDLIFECLENARDASPYVPEMKSMSIENLLRARANKYLPEGEKLKEKGIGLQPGEKHQEKSRETGKYSNEVEQFTVEDIQQLI